MMTRAGTRNERWAARKGTALRATQLARHHRLKPMKHNLTLDHVKKEARDLLHGLQRRDRHARQLKYEWTLLLDPATPSSRLRDRQEDVNTHAKELKGRMVSFLSGVFGAR